MPQATKKARPKSKGVLVDAARKADRPPVWAGPCGAGPQGGVTQSLISRWLSCRERFRLLVIDGWKTQERFTPTLDFGNMWHCAEENLAANRGWEKPLAEYSVGLCRRFPLQQNEINDWYEKCRALFPLYVEHWAEHPDVKNRQPLLQEQTFDVPYKLPSGRTARLRGKWDSVDLIDGGVWIQENKTKSGIDSQAISRQVTFDLQSMVYILALRERQSHKPLVSYGSGASIKGVRYNCVRRAAHKTAESMLEKFGVDSRNGRIGEWFARWQVTISPADVAKFKRECLDPVLENMCDDFEWWSWCRENKADPFDYGRRVVQRHENRHFRLPFGIYSPVHEGGSSDLDALLESGSTVGLRQVSTLFPELENG